MATVHGSRLGRSRLSLHEKRMYGHLAYLALAGLIGMFSIMGLISVRADFHPFIRVVLGWAIGSAVIQAMLVGYHANRRASRGHTDPLDALVRMHERRMTQHARWLAVAIVVLLGGIYWVSTNLNSTSLIACSAFAAFAFGHFTLVLRHRHQYRKDSDKMRDRNARLEAL